MPRTAEQNEWVRRVLGVEAAEPGATAARFEEELFLKNALAAFADYVTVRDTAASLSALDTRLSRAEKLVADWEKDGPGQRGAAALARMEDLAARVALERSGLDEVIGAIARIGDQLGAARAEAGGTIPDETHRAVLDQLKDLAS